MSKGRGLLLGQCISPEYTEFIVSLFEGLLEASLLLLTIWLLCTFCPLLRPISRWIWQWEEWGKGLGGNCPLLWIFFFFFFALVISLFTSVSQSCPTLCDPMNRSMPGLPVHHQLPNSTQTHVYWVGDAIQPSLSSPSPPALNLSQHQGLFKWVSS